jgi:hypothetical protein
MIAPVIGARMQGPIASALLAVLGCGAPSGPGAERIAAPRPREVTPSRVGSPALAAPEVCRSESDCPAPKHCVAFDRGGNDAFDEGRQSPFREWRQLCVSACTSDADCPRGFGCHGHVEYVVFAPEGGEGTVEAHTTCAPVSPYGNAARGEPCTRDDDCAAGAAYCVSDRCVSACMRCPPDCECADGYTCSRFQTLSGSRSGSAAYCVPTTPESANELAPASID